MSSSVKLVLICTFLYSCPTFVATAPQIFTDIYTFCEFTFSGEKKLSFPNKIWNITKRDFIINFSLCKSAQSECGNWTSSCLKLRKNDEITDLGHEFITSDSDDFRLISQNGARCSSNPSKNYTLSILLECSDSIKSIPRLMATDDEDECFFEVTMMRPDCHPKCTELIRGAYLLDIRNFPKNIHVQSETKNFSLTLCGANINCGQDISGCEISNDAVMPLMKIETQHLNYDISKNELTARGRYKKGRVQRDVQILIKCKWETDVVSVKYKKVPIQGQHYKFELESSFGCVKLPYTCTVSSVDNLNYDLSKLYVTNGWEVRETPGGRILLNICGPLNQLKGVCADQHSQVCHIHNQNYLNRGSILSSLKAYNDVIKAVFVSGSTCEENSELLYSTEIEFRCTKTEKGPMFKEYKGCVMLLIWETPHACPIDHYTSSECYINDRISNRNLKKLHTESDRVHPFANDGKTKLIYNICGPIHTPCNNYTNVSFCLKTEQNETVIGWESTNLVSENGLIRMEVSTTRSREVVVNFICTYEDPLPDPQIIVEDGYKYNLTIFTSLACLTQESFNDCVYSADNLTYDLSPLVQRNKNYVIRDKENIEYIFNLCGPIIGGSEALCRGNTMVCLRNKTEDNIKYRYTSLGGVGKPRLVNNTLVVESKMGSYCEELGHYKSIIHFECFEKKMPPTFLSKIGCVYNFQWKTPEACPQERNCIVKSASDVTINLNHLQHKSFRFNVDNSTIIYEFHLCNDHYVEYSNDMKTIYPLNRDFLTSEYNSFLVLDLRKNCTNNSAITKVVFEMKCSQGESDYFKKQSFENCTLNMIVYTNLVCLTKEKHIPYSIIDPESSKEHERITDVIPNLQKEKNCTIVNPKLGYEFSLKNIPTEELFFSGSNFIINFDKDPSQCRTLFCKDDNALIPKMCPVVFFNYTNRFLKLEYSSTNKCNSHDFYTLEVLLKCNQTTSTGRIVKDEVCRSVVAYDLPQACELLKEDIISSVPVAAIASSVASVLALIFGFILILYLGRRRCPYLQHYILFRRNCDKTDVPIYVRNCSE